MKLKTAIAKTFFFYLAPLPTLLTSNQPDQLCKADQIFPVTAANLQTETITECPKNTGLDKFLFFSKLSNQGQSTEGKEQKEEVRNDDKKMNQIRIFCINCIHFIRLKIQNIKLFKNLINEIGLFTLHNCCVSCSLAI